MDNEVKEFEKSQQDVLKSRLNSIKGDSITPARYHEFIQGIKNDDTQTIHYIELTYWHEHLTVNSSDAEASKALGEMDDIDPDGLGLDIYRYNTDGIDNSVLAEDNINSFIEEDEDDVRDAKQDHDKQTLADAKSQLKDDKQVKEYILSQPNIYYYGGTYTPVEATTVLDFINQEL